MQKLRTVLLFAGVLLVMLVSAVLLKVMSQRQEIRARGPLTMAELNRIASRWDSAPQARTAPDVREKADRSQSEGASIVRDNSPHSAHRNSPVLGDDLVDTAASHERDGPTPVRDAAGSAPSPAQTHTSLKRTLTQAEKDDLAARYRKENRSHSGWIAIPTMEYFAVAGLAAGLDQSAGAMHLCEAGQAAFFWTGDWETARRLYRQALEYPLEDRFRQGAYLRLAWMEDDPEVAGRLLELACPAGAESPDVLIEAAQLAYATGSRELFESYVARLQVLKPDQATRLRSFPPIQQDASVQKSLARN